MVQVRLVRPNEGLITVKRRWCSMALLGHHGSQRSIVGSFERVQDSHNNVLHTVLLEHDTQNPRLDNTPFDTFAKSKQALESIQVVSNPDTP